VAHDVWVSESLSLISQCLRTPGTVSRLMIEDLQRACLSRGCLTLCQLQRVLRLVPPQGVRTWVELLMSRLDGLGLDATNPLWVTPREPLVLVSEAVCTYFWSALRGNLGRDQQGGSPASAHLLRSCALCLSAMGKLATKGILYAAHLSMGEGLWAPRLMLHDGLSTEEYLALTDMLSAYYQRGRTTEERSQLPGPRQLTLFESLERRRCPPGAAQGCRSASRPGSSM